LTRIILAIAAFLHARGLYQTSEYYLRAVHTHQNDMDSRIAVLSFLGEAVQKQGRLLEARAIFQEGVSLARATNNEEQLCVLLSLLGWVTWKVGEFTQAEASLLEGLTLARQKGYQEHKLLRLLGSVSDSQGKYAQAERYLQEG